VNVIEARARATADPPFDFAQGRLFGDDNKKSYSNEKTGNSVKAGELREA
jgi:hypothetical protein